MALIKCSECGKQISDKSKVCIHCGCPIETRKKDKIICNECGNELNKNDNVCKKCGYPIIKKEIPKNKIKDVSDKSKSIAENKNNKILLIIGCIIGGIIILGIIGNMMTPTTNIIGTWEYTTILSGNTGYVERYEFKENGKAILQTGAYSGLISKGTGYSFNCTYKFRYSNTQIKISCDYEKKETRDKKNKWVNFKQDGDKIYIDNKEYKHKY